MSKSIQDEAMELELFIRSFIPKGWRENLQTVMFCPMITEADYISIRKGEIPTTSRYQQPMIEVAIKVWLSKNQ
jgi:hypothetical protein